MVRELYFQSGGPEYDSSSLPLDVNSQLVCLLSVGIFNHVIFIKNYLFPLFQWYAWKLAVLAKCIGHYLYIYIKKIHLHFFTSSYLIVTENLFPRSILACIQNDFLSTYPRCYKFTKT